jgi:hypothetical protein
MAKISPSSLINGASGAVGSIVFSRNRGGFYSRSRVTPANPSSTAQVNWRAAFKSASQRWSLTLTESQRKQWRTYAQNLTRVNRLGMPIPVNGFNAYVEANTYAIFTAANHIDTPPATPRYPVLYTISAVTAVGIAHFNVSWTGPSLLATGRFLCFASKPLPPGRNAPNGSWSIFLNIHADVAQPRNIWVGYTALYGAPVAGQVTFMRARIVDYQTGIPSPWLYQKLTWSA